ncbi:PREDICTED: indole-3-acetaldehyde oxidase-like [Papilio xuthus]|uniref:Indole-3-acetaldehyde oxidase-like n=1 Tax=Papilio xuthus TaxID=66420 RepID=A0AAJ7E481_PAPXU|nr:PREDICTED: indole-3-acetaldehyde oxidase-like [Papilio xuthus]XP_013162077.1 PREDICTED: indole-3-acetaldehyde oxidase-like [Papilio xuthus]
MDKIYFFVNGQRYTSNGSDVDESTSLNDYLRNTLGLFGTKSMCNEGGCGACVVSVAQYNPVTKAKDVFAVNSCLVHILSCHTWEITTIEGLGNQRVGYHPLQSRLAMFNGTQCGYCTPGLIMNMYSLYKSSSKKLTTQEIERSFGSNICRCTGYRPILDSFKSFANDTDPQIQDLEDLDQMKCLKPYQNDCNLLDEEWCVIEKTKKLQLEGSKPNRWYKAFTLQDVFKILAKEGVDSYRLVAGNTGKGVYPIKEEPRVHIDISSIEGLKDATRSVNLVLGGGMSLTEMMRVFKVHAKYNEDFQYLEHFYEHLELVAHIPVRNIGTIGGNLALKNAHNEFPSDIFLLLQTVEAMVAVVDNNLHKTDVSMSDFLKLDLRNKLIVDVKLPPLSSNDIIRTYKIMPRAQNAHAIVNAGFLFQLSSSNVTSCCLVFGNISPDFIRAKETERLLKGLDLYKDESLQKALAKLSQEIVPKEFPTEPSPHCRKAIALGLFYKAILSQAPSVNPRFKSGGSLLNRPVSSGTQTFDTDKSIWPLNQPVQKLEGLTQCSGEVRYSCDMRYSQRDVHVAFVLATEAVADIKNINATDALKVPGVIAFFSAKDIPGKNSFTPLDVPWQDVVEEILASKRVSYYGQPIGLIVAGNQKLAIKAAELVQVKYKKIADPVLTISDVLVAPDKDKRLRKDVSTKASDRGKETTHVVKGEFTIPDQYHYTMETQSCAVTPTSRGLELRSATQWMDLVHVAVARTVNLPLNCVEVSVPRLGGGYGGKGSRSAQVACACALAAHLLRRPAHLVMPLTHNMHAIGKRSACLFQYELGVNDAGVVQYLNITYYSDCGCSYNDTQTYYLADSLNNLYDSKRFNITGYSVLTDKASNTWCRAPATTEAAAIMEHIMERIAHVTKKDPIDVRIANLAQKNDPLKEMIATFKMEINYDDRKSEIAEYNKRNAWKKRALKLSIMSFKIEYSGNYPVTISVYHGDGSVLISHGGIEMGQGINTKVAQVCAYALGIPLDKVQVKGADSFVSPNAMASNGSITSECVAYATLKACKELLKRLEPAKKGIKEPTWEQIVKKSYDNGVNLQTSSMTSPLDSLLGYDVYGVCCTEVCLDVLTGQHQVLRVDILEDTGQSISPNVDVGQIEGAFVMGLGLWTCERLQYARSGRLLTDRTWTYKPPGALDIPIDFRINFRRNSTNNAGVLRSKATGEPALVLAVAVTLALHEALLEGRKEFGYEDHDWLHVDTPYSIENIMKALAHKIQSFKLQ